jgi:hypothetical protein
VCRLIGERDEARDERCAERACQVVDDRAAGRVAFVQLAERNEACRRAEVAERVRDRVGDVGSPRGELDAQLLERLDGGDDVGPPLRALQRAEEIERLLEERFDERGVRLDANQVRDAAQLRVDRIGGADSVTHLGDHRGGVLVDR